MWPSPWPGAFAITGSWQVMPGHCEVAGSPSKSEPREMTGFPAPHEATNAVGMESNASCTVKPLSRSRPTRKRDDSISWKPNSP